MSLGQGSEDPSDKPSLRFVAVTGWLRSGTTLLAEILGSTPGSVALGELHHCWRAWISNTPCSCGAPGRECPVWGAAIEAVLPDLDVAYARHLESLSGRLTRNRNFPAMALSRTSPGLTEYVKVLRSVLDEVALNAKAPTLIDTSKSGSSLLLMALTEPARFDVVHLVRDVRGVAWSQGQDAAKDWASTRDSSDSNPPPTRGLARSTAEWLIGNLGLAYAGHRVGQYVRVSYEDLMKAPKSQVESLCGLLDLESSALDWEAEPVALILRGQHVIAGNMARFGSRRRVLRLDEKWRQGMDPRAQAALGGVAALGKQVFRPSKSLRLP